MGAYTNPGVETAVDIVHQAHIQLLDAWLKTSLFTWRWWLEVVVAVGAWTAWILLRNKQNTDRLLLAGLFTSASASFMDTIGVALGLWSYPAKIAPLIPPFFTFDVTIIPVLTMFTLQYKPNVNPIVKSIILSIMGSFILQPVAAWLGIYNPRVWKHFYSFPIVIVVYLISNFLYNRRSWKLHCN